MTGIAWYEWWLPFRSWRIVCSVEAADEIPKSLPERGVVVVGSSERPKWIAFDCPCRSGHRIMITLDPGHRPHWHIVSRKRLTLSPSVDYRGNGRRCHYFVRNGSVEWIHGE
ncbi:MAG: DUF6527 family protein [Planctomycetota bacterium]